MKLKRLVMIFLTLILMVCQSGSAMACTIFTIEMEEGTTLVGNNEDFSYPINNFLDNWILWICGICILVYIVFPIVKKIKRKKDINNKLLEIANASMI